MPEAMLCEICGSDGALRVEAAVTIIGEVVAGQPTSTTDAVDACDKCRPKALKLLLSHVADEFEDQVPFHRQLLGKVAEIEEATARGHASAPALLAWHDAHAHEASPQPPPDEIVVPHKEALLAVSQAEAERQGILADAEAKSHTHKTAFRKKLTS